MTIRIVNGEIVHDNSPSRSNSLGRVNNNSTDNNPNSQYYTSSGYSSATQQEAPLPPHARGPRIIGTTAGPTQQGNHGSYRPQQPHQNIFEKIFDWRVLSALILIYVCWNSISSNPGIALILIAGLVYFLSQSLYFNGNNENNGNPPPPHPSDRDTTNPVVAFFTSLVSPAASNTTNPAGSDATAAPGGGTPPSSSTTSNNSAGRRLGSIHDVRRDNM
eukprot:TRINITY_DN8038_c0_g1_i1.p1 TRINITY_DN8038_c0_g1~~TRINITY_DN8038_c0_g1_i1.p1  ORF type:complete len:218 (-),score=46.81 TRINITY_DN8038_c0_g1_i1:44-697(-)